MRKPGWGKRKAEGIPAYPADGIRIVNGSFAERANMHWKAPLESVGNFSLFIFLLLYSLAKIKAYFYIIKFETECQIVFESLLGYKRSSEDDEDPR
jgi:hypothetical protein